MPDYEKQFQQMVDRLNIDDAPRPGVQQQTKARALDVFMQSQSVQSRTRKPQTWRLIMQSRISKIAAGFILAAVLITLIMFFQTGTTGSVVFAQVLDQVKQFQTVSFTLTATNGDHVKQATYFKMDAAGHVHSEMPDGKIGIGNTQLGKFILLDAKAGKATVIEGMEQPANLFDKLKQLKEEQGVARGQRDINGRQTNGFEVVTRNEKMTIWADVNTGLPLLIEVRPPDAESDAPLIGTVHDFVYNQPFDDSLFDMTIPDDYTIEKLGGVPVDKQQPPATPEQIKNLVITPLVGFKKVPFGSTKQQILDALGQPDDIQRDIDHRYLSKGFAVMVDSKAGLFTINCFSKVTAGPFALNDFPGQTDKGIRMDSTRDAIISVYGQPDLIENRGQLTSLRYYKLNMEFSLKDDHVVNMLFFAPRPEKP